MDGTRLDLDTLERSARSDLEYLGEGPANAEERAHLVAILGLVAYARRLEARVAELEGDRDEHYERANSNFDTALIWKAERDEAAARVAELEAAIEKHRMQVVRMCGSEWRSTLEEDKNADEALWAALAGTAEREQT